jgi:hypothetical protein
VSRMCREWVQYESVMLQCVECLDSPKFVLRSWFREMSEAVVKWLSGLSIRKSWIQVLPPELRTHLRLKGFCMKRDMVYAIPGRAQDAFRLPRLSGQRGNSSRESSLFPG